MAESSQVRIHARARRCRPHVHMDKNRLLAWRISKRFFRGARSASCYRAYCNKTSGKSFAEVLAVRSGPVSSRVVTSRKGYWPWHDREMVRRGWPATSKMAFSAGYDRETGVEVDSPLMKLTGLMVFLPKSRCHGRVAGVDVAATGEAVSDNGIRNTAGWRERVHGLGMEMGVSRSSDSLSLHMVQYMNSYNKMGREDLELSVWDLVIYEEEMLASLGVVVTRL